MAFDLSSVKRGVRMKAPKLVLYGVGGIGKTTFAAGAPEPIFLFTEEGQGLLDVARFELRPDDPVLRSWDELMQAVMLLYKEQHEFQTVVVDTFDFAEALLWQHVSKIHQKSGIADFDYGKGFRFAVDHARPLLEWLDALRRDRGMTIILLAHAKHDKFEPPDAPTYEQWNLRLHDQLGGLVHDWADAVLFANYEQHVVKDDEGFGRERARAVGMGRRLVYTQKMPAYVAKNRYGLPPTIDLKWSAFVDGIVAPPKDPPQAQPQPQPEPQPAKE